MRGLEPFIRCETLGNSERVTETEPRVKGATSTFAAEEAVDAAIDFHLSLP